VRTGGGEWHQRNTTGARPPNHHSGRNLYSAGMTGAEGGPNHRHEGAAGRRDQGKRVEGFNVRG